MNRIQQAKLDAARKHPAEYELEVLVAQHLLSNPSDTFAEVHIPDQNGFSWMIGASIPLQHYDRRCSRYEKADVYARWAHPNGRESKEVVRSGYVHQAVLSWALGCGNGSPKLWFSRLPRAETHYLFWFNIRI